MKTKIINISLIAILAMISLNISAHHGSLKDHSNVETSMVPSTEMEESGLNIEAWMAELKKFNLNTFRFTDEEIQIEKWMTVKFSISAETERSLDEDIRIEDWMINTTDFRNEEIVYDFEPEIEPWMYTIMK